jgi:hypothetical protein
VRETGERIAVERADAGLEIDLRNPVLLTMMDWGTPPPPKLADPGAFKKYLETPTSYVSRCFKGKANIFWAHILI